MQAFCPTSCSFAVAYENYDDVVYFFKVGHYLFLRLTLLVLLALGTFNQAVANPIVSIETPAGTFDIELLEDEAPLTVANFLGYVERGDYTGTFIHRSVPDFVLQAGGYTYVASNNTAPHIDTQPPVVNEFGRSNIRGTVAMAKVGGDPDSATSEWFVNLGDNSDNLDNQNGGFTVFGVVVGDGMTVVDSIAALPTQNFGGAFTDTPTINYQGTITPEIFVTLDSLTVTQASDFDGDGMSDADDPDDDNDGVPDTTDVFPFNATESADLDADGIGDNADTDDDGDGISDDVDAFPTDGNEWLDSDGDGIGDNADEDQNSNGYAYLFTNSASNNVTALHVINTSDQPQRFVGNLYAGSGELIGQADFVLNQAAVAAQGRLILSAADVETLSAGSTWSGPALLKVSGTAAFEIMSKLVSPSGLISNTNCVRQTSAHNVEGFDSGTRTFVRFINTGSETISDIRGTLYDTNGSAVGPGEITLVAELAPLAATWVNRDDLAELTGTEWQGVATLRLSQNIANLNLLNLNFVNEETFFNFSCFEGSDSSRVFLMTNSASMNISETHLINTGDADITFTGTVVNRDGEQLGDAAASLHQDVIVPNGRLILNAADVEMLSSATTWSGPATIEVAASNQDFELMTRLTSPSGLISNTNCVRQDSVHNIEGFDSDTRTFVRFINQGVTDIGAISGTLYDRNGSVLGSGQLLESLSAGAAVWLTREDLSSLFDVTWNEEASLTVTAEDDESLRLLNLNFVNEETFFNFSCYESATVD